MHNSNPPFNSGNTTFFPSFFEEWGQRQERFLQELVSASTEHRSEDDQKRLIENVLSHDQQYYQAKSISAHENIFNMFCPSWFTTLERTFCWISGFKPGLLFQIVNKSVNDLLPQQVDTLAELRRETRLVERDLADQYVAIQESFSASPKLIELTRRGGRLVDGESYDVDEVLEKVRSSMEGLVGNADSLRITTFREIVEVLTPDQGVRFLGGVGLFYRRNRINGQEIDANRL